MTQHELPTVGFIGLGDQGSPMATAIAAAGYPLHAWDRRPESSGSRTSDTSVLVDLATACDVHGLLTGGLAEHLHEGAVVVNHGTGTPKAAREMAASCAAHGLEFLDAPVSGARASAQSHTLTTLVGGPADVLARCEPVFRTFSAHVAHLGPHGSGQLAKLVNNILMMTNRANVAEILDRQAAAGISPMRVIEAVKLCSGTSRSLQILPVGDLDAVTNLNADHLNAVELTDMDVFAAAMTDLGVDAADITTRARRGAERLGAVLKPLNPHSEYVTRTPPPATSSAGERKCHSH
jgi:3-hydroxyisobutyrate dehydrogenase-like beta-hydroxyacid dehydrogenase